MEIKNEFYPQFLNKPVSDIPVNILLDIIDELASNARFYMNSDIDAVESTRISSAVLDMLKGQFKYLMLALVSEAYTRGSLGELGGTTKFSVRNVYTWLCNIEEKNQRLYQESRSKEDSDRRAAEEKAFRQGQATSVIYAAAFRRKMELCQAGLLSDAEYDRCSVEKIANLIRGGYKTRDIFPSTIK